MNHRKDLRDLKISRIHFLNLWKERAPDGVFEMGDVCDKGDEKPTNVLGDEEPTSVDMVVGTQTGSTVGLKRLGEGEGEEGVTSPGVVTFDTRSVSVSHVGDLHGVMGGGCLW